jgi:hypothetical protein
MSVFINDARIGYFHLDPNDDPATIVGELFVRAVIYDESGQYAYETGWTIG